MLRSVMAGGTFGRETIGDGISRFLRAWLTFGAAGGLSAMVLTLPLSIWELFEPTGAIDDLPPGLAIVASIAAGVAALVIGAVLAPFRRFIVGPEAPFVRPGYLVLAALPLVALLSPDLGWPERAYLFAAIEVFLGINILLFVWIGRPFGVFPANER